MSQKDIDKASSEYDMAIESGVKGDLYPGQFNRLFPGTDNGISYYTGGAGPRRWWSKGALHGRYVVEMVVPIELDRAATNLISTGEPSFYLYEFTSISFRSNRAPVIQARQMGTFSTNEWRRLTEAKGDFGALGIVLQTNKPVENFENAWRRFN